MTHIESEGDAEMTNEISQAHACLHAGCRLGRCAYRSEPRPVDEIDGFRVNDVVRTVDSTGYGKSSDLWKIDALYQRDADPFASLVLVGRAGGLPRGETRTAIRLSLIRKVELQPPTLTEYDRGVRDALRAVALVSDPAARCAEQLAAQLGVEL